MAETIQDRNVVVTGGTGGLGRVVVERLVQAGAICHVPSRHDEPPTTGNDRLRLVGGVDLMDEAAVARFYGGVPDLWASVHLAGGFAGAKIAEASSSDFLGMFRLNALTVFLCSQAAVRRMRETGKGGRIVNVSARPGIEHRKGARMVAYGTSKAAVAAMTEALAEELKHDHILVNAIAPSTIDTAANRKSMPDVDPAKWLTPAAAAETILQLISPQNVEISGAVLPLYARA